MESRLLIIRIGDSSWATGNFSYSKSLTDEESGQLFFRIGLAVSNFFRPLFGLSKFVFFNGLEGGDMSLGRAGIERRYLLLESEVDRIRPENRRTSAVVSRLGTAGMSPILPATRTVGVAGVKESKVTTLEGFIAKLDEASERASVGLGDRNFILAPFGGETGFITACKKIAQTDPSDKLFKSQLRRAREDAPKGRDQDSRAALLDQINELWSHK